MKKIVYVTGCLGFIGYHVAKRCLNAGYYVIGVDNETYASNLSFINLLQNYKTFKYINDDINNLEKLYDCDCVINCAAETHVDNSITSSDIFLKSNINGVHRLLELIREKPDSRKPILLHFSTDEVYGDIVTGFHKENSPLNPSNPYAATKAAADMLILAWARTYNVPFNIVRPSNNYGIGQYVEKFIPRACKNLVLGKPIILHDKGQPKRTWLFVGDTAEAIITIINSEVRNQIFNISGNYENRNIVVAKKIIDCCFEGSKVFHEDYISCTEVRPGQDIRYAIDDTKLLKLGWSPKAVFDVELKNIVTWYKNNFIW